MSRVLINFLGGDPEHPSGIVVYALRQIEALLRRNAHDYVLLTQWPRDILAQYLPLDRVQLVAGRSDRSEKLQYLIGAWQVSRTARRLDIDSVFTPWPLAPFVGGRRRVLVLHDLYRRTHPELHNWHHRLGWDLMFPLSVRRSETVIAVSEATATQFRRHYPWAAHKLAVVHEAPALRAAPRLDPPVPKPYGLTVSTPAATKNLPRLIAALEILRQRGQEIPLYWIGADDGSVAREVQKYPLLKSFRPVGRVDDETLASFYAHAGAYVCASLTEGFCLPVLEAHSHGVPVVCSDIDVLHEVAGEGALYFHPGDSGEIADALGAIAMDAALRTELAQAARLNVQRFSWDRSAERIETLLSL